MSHLHVHSGRVTFTNNIMLDDLPPDLDCPDCQLVCAQAAYVEAWRREHPDSLYTDEWKCPLCRYCVQADSDQWLDHDVKIHTDSHGQDWTAYLAAGAAPAAGGGEGDGR